MISRSLETGLLNARVIVCAGTGGVGKTTISAALGLVAARLGRRALILTIDPARRLAEALGEGDLGLMPNRIDVSKIVGATAPPWPGTVDAVMLDAKPTFDRLITRLTDDPAARSRILDNRIYRHLSEALAGSAEYAAMEQVHEFVESGDYDLVVVDTPPSSHALDFLSAPRRLREFLESRFVHTLVRPAMSAGRFGFRFFGRPLHRMFGLLEKIAGIGFLEDLTEFLSAIDGLSEGFRERATRVESVLLGDDTQFVLVCGPGSGEDPSTFEFLEELESLGVHLAAVVINRVQPWPLEQSAQAWREAASKDVLARDTERLRDALSDADATNPPDLAEWVIEMLVEAGARREKADLTLRALEARVATRHISCHCVPELADELDRQNGLHTLGLTLVPEAKHPIADQPT